METHNKIWIEGGPDKDIRGVRIDTSLISPFKAEIRRNSYDFQSWGKVSVWYHGTGWVEVHTMQIDELPIGEHYDDGRGMKYWGDAYRLKDDSEHYSDMELAMNKSLTLLLAFGAEVIFAEELRDSSAKESAEVLSFPVREADSHEEDAHT